jgi:hypothetical protein
VLGEISGSRGIALPGTEWQGDDTLRITTPLREPHSFVLLAQPVSAAAH